MGNVTAVVRENGDTIQIENEEQWRKLADDELIELIYDYSSQLLPAQSSRVDGMWRYMPLLPIDHSRHLYPLSIGGTPLIASPSLRHTMKMDELWIKDETRSPSGSNKDRATALVLEQALLHGVTTVSCASTGNVAVSLALGAAATGMRAFIFVPATVAPTKLQLMVLSGATVFKVQEGYEAAVKLSRQAARTFGWYDRNTGYNPLTLEAKKTVALELWEQLGYRLPDVVVIPVGDGVTLSGIAKGFRELMLCGATERIPRLIGVQAEGCQPIGIAWKNNTQIQPSKTATIADGIAVGDPINGTMALRDVSRSRGDFVIVSDAAILQAVQTLLTKGGILAEPAGAAAFAGLEQGLTSGLISHDETVVVLVTGTGMKTLQQIPATSTSNVYQIHARLDEVKALFEQLD